VKSSLVSRSVAEFLGTLLLVAGVLGAGHMVDRLQPGAGLGLLMIAVAVGSILVGLIATIGPISGAHLNPVVTAFMVLSGRHPVSESAAYVSSQIAGALGGALVANAMFERQLYALSDIQRSGWGQWVGEGLATFGLVFLILVLVASKNIAWVPVSVGLWIVAGHIFTSSTSFANPAVTLGRMVSDAGNGIAPESVLPFVLAQFVGGLCAWGLASVVARAFSLSGSAD